MSLSALKDAVKQVPISAVVGHYIPLQKKGINYEGICPFHQDTHPSLKVNDSKELYKCFVCEAAGDSIHFVQELKRLDFKEALVEIADFSGIHYDNLDSKKQPEDPKFKMGQRVLHSALRIYRKIGRELNHPALEEFSQKRKLHLDTIDHFQIGFAPGNNVLLNYLQSVPNEERNFALQIAEEIGMIKKGNNGHYDTFRERIMFPIWDQFGTLRGFGSRSIHPDQKPKYLNSFESFMFNKRMMLYGLNLAKSSLREKDCAILVEGYMDTATMHQFGFNNTVATMGIAISEEMAETLKKLTPNIYLGLDSDQAGWNAMKRIAPIFYKLGIIPKLIRYAPQKDPDEFLHLQGSIPLQERMETAPAILDAEIDEIAAAVEGQGTDQKLEALQQIFSIVAPLGERLSAQERIADAIKKLKLNSSKEAVLNSYFQSLRQKKVYSEKIQPQITTNTPVSDPIDKQEKEIILSNRAKSQENLPLQAEKAVLKDLLLHPDLLEHVKISELLEVLGHSEVKRIVRWLEVIYREVDETEFANVVRSRLSECDFQREISEYVYNVLFSFSPSTIDGQLKAKWIDELVQRLKKEQLFSKRSSLLEKMKFLSAESEEAMNLHKELQDTNLKLHELEKRPGYQRSF